jgi:hypothetical protein
MVLTASFVLSPVIGLCCHRRLADTSARLERQRRGVRTTRLRRPHHTPFVKGASTSTASRPASVTIAIRPSSGTRRRGFCLIWVDLRSSLFLRVHLDTWNHVDVPQEIAFKKLWNGAWKKTTCPRYRIIRRGIYGTTEIMTVQFLRGVTSHGRSSPSRGSQSFGGWV